MVVDNGPNHVSLSWLKPRGEDYAPVIGYRVEAWLIGKESDASWKELGIAPTPNFDAINLKSGSEYHFRITPKNRYGLGPPVQTSYPIMFGDVVKLPEFTKILPGQLKALLGQEATFECVSLGSPKPTIIWYKDGIKIESDERRIQTQVGAVCKLTIKTVIESDCGRYTCEASNKEGRVSTFVRLQTVSDPRILEADNKLKKNVESDSENLDEMIPQFTMRLRDRRVQCTYPVRLTCQTLSYPAPSISWQKDGVDLVENQRIAFFQEDNFSTLEISRTYLEDSGFYTVTAKNELGSVSCHCNLIVDKGIRAYISPDFFKSLDPIYTYNENDDIRLIAHVEAYPSVGVTWHHDGLRLRPSRRIAATLDSDGLVQLIITGASIKDAGVYTCVASNAVGRVESTCRVLINESPDRKSRVLPELAGIDAP
jgi:hypothetical protein